MPLHHSRKKRGRVRACSHLFRVFLFSVLYFFITATVLALFIADSKRDISSFVSDQNRVLKSLGSRIFDSGNSNISNAIALHGALPKDRTLSGLTLPRSLSIVSVIAADGWLVASTGKFNEPVYLGDRRHFQVHKSEIVGAEDLYVGPPVLGRVSGVVTLQLSRAVRRDDGTLESVYVASYVLDDLTNILNELPSQIQTVRSIYGYDQILRASSSGWEATDGAEVLSFGSHISCSFFVICSFRNTNPDEDIDLVYISSVNDVNLIYLQRIHIMGGAILYGLAFIAYLYFRDYYKSEITRSRLDQVVRSANLSRYVSLGQMAAAFAHEVGTPAQTIRLAIDNLRRELTEDQGPIAKQSLKRIIRVETAVERIANLSNALKRFSNREGNSESDISKCVRECVDIVDPILKICKIDIACEGADHLFVGCKNEELQSIMINLIDNARDSINNEASTNRLIRIQWHAISGFANITIEDTGSGIRDDIMDRIFDPLFSTKADGNGIGLALVASIVNRYNGTVSARNSSDGAIFTVTLPLDVRKEVGRIHTSPLPPSGNLDP